MKLDAILEIYTNIDLDHVAFRMQLTIPPGRGKDFKERFKALALEFDPGAVIDISSIIGIDGQKDTENVS